MEVRKGYKQTEVGVIPEDWEVITLGDVAEIKMCKRIFAEQTSINGDIPFYKIGTFGKKPDAYISEFLYQGYKSNYSFPRKGDILLSAAGTLGRTVVYDGEPSYYQDSNIVWLDVDKNRISNKYLFQYYKIIKWASPEGSTISRLYNGIIRKTKILLPPLAEQETIAEALSDADALIEAVEQLLTKKRQVKQGAMSELLTGKRRLPGFGGKWRSCELGELIVHCSSGATPYRGRLDYYKGTVKWITSGELNYNVITDTIEHISNEAVEKTNLKVHPVGTFLMAITGLEAAGTRGSCGIVGSPSTTNQSCMAIYPTPELKTEFLYHYYVLRGNELALKYCQGTKQQSYTAKLVKLLPIDIPPTVAEQTAIAEILSDMDAEISALEGKLVKARQVKAGMMSELLGGRSGWCNVQT